MALPGITKEWSFQDNHSANVGLAAAVFTAVLADTDTLTAIVGADSSSVLAVVTMAAAASVALIGTGPLWLGLVVTVAALLDLVPAW